MSLDLHVTPAIDVANSSHLRESSPHGVDGSHDTERNLHGCSCGLGHGSCPRLLVGSRGVGEATGRLQTQTCRTFRIIYILFQ